MKRIHCRRLPFSKVKAVYESLGMANVPRDVIAEALVPNEVYPLPEVAISKVKASNECRTILNVSL